MDVADPGGLWLAVVGWVVLQGSQCLGDRLGLGAGLDVQAPSCGHFGDDEGTGSQRVRTSRGICLRCPPQR
jgi:hypothetical protein